MQNDALKRNKQLGYIEKTEIMWLARYPEKAPEVHWHDLATRWREPLAGDCCGMVPTCQSTRVMIENLWAEFFICHNSALVSDRGPEKGFIRLGFLAYRENLVSIQEKRNLIEITVGDIFLTQQDEKLEIRAPGLFVYGTKDIRECNLPNVEKARRLFLRDVEKIRHYSIEHMGRHEKETHLQPSYHRGA